MAAAWHLSYIVKPSTLRDDDDSSARSLGLSAKHRRHRSVRGELVPKSCRYKNEA